MQVLELGLELGPGDRLGIAPQENIGAATGHVGGDGDGARPARLGDDLRLALGVARLGVEHVMDDPRLDQLLAELFRLVHRARADQHRPAVGLALLDRLDDGVELGVLRRENPVRQHRADAGAIGRPAPTHSL